MKIFALKTSSLHITTRDDLSLEEKGVVFMLNAFYGDIERIIKFSKPSDRENLNDILELLVEKGLVVEVG